VLVLVLAMVALYLTVLWISKRASGKICSIYFDLDLT
jgi:hypothetical protein